MSKDDTGNNPKIHVVPKFEWDGKFPVFVKNAAALSHVYDKINRRKSAENITKHRRRHTDIHVAPKLKQPFFPSSDVTE